MCATHSRTQWPLPPLGRYYSGQWPQPRSQPQAFHGSSVSPDHYQQGASSETGKTKGIYLGATAFLLALSFLSQPSALDETCDPEATLCCPQMEGSGRRVGVITKPPTYLAVLWVQVVALVSGTSVLQIPHKQLLYGKSLPGPHLLICHEFDGRLGGNFDDIDAIAPPERLGSPFPNHLCKSADDAHIVAAGGMDLTGRRSQRNSVGLRAATVPLGRNTRKAPPYE